MSLNFTTDVFDALYASYVGNDANYQSPGNFGLPATDSGSVGVASATIGTRGSYTSIPSATAPGGVTFGTQMRLLTVASTASGGTRGYVPGDVLNVTGGYAESVQPTLQVTNTQVVGAITIVGVGSGGTPGAATLTGTTGTGTKFQATVVIQANGTLTGAPAPVLTVAGNYTVNPTLLTAEPVTSTASLAGVTVSINMGVLTATIDADGVFSSLPPSPATTYDVTTSAGTGATFTFTYAVDSLVVLSAGAYEAGSSAPTITFSSGAATATATLGSAGTSAIVEEKLLTLVEIFRSLIAETTSTNQLRDIHVVLRKLMATMKFGGQLTYSAATIATRAQSAALNYIAKNPTHSPQPLFQGYGVGFVEPPEDLT